MSVAIASAVDTGAPLAKNRKLPPSGLHDAAYAQHEFCIYPVVALEHVLEPLYWHHHTHKIKPGDVIRAFAEDRSYWALLLVHSVGDNTAKIEPLLVKKFGGDADTDYTPIPGYTVSWRGPNGRYAVVRDADKSVIHANCLTKEEAQKWMIDNKRSLLA